MYIYTHDTMHCTQYAKRWKLHARKICILYYTVLRFTLRYYTSPRLDYVAGDLRPTGRMLGGELPWRLAAQPLQTFGKGAEWHLAWVRVYL